MPSINNVFLVGHLGADPELRTTASGATVCKLSLATNRWRRRDSDAPEETDWHRITVWERQAENCGRYLRKGSTVAVEGSIRYSKAEGKDGQVRYFTDIVARRVTFLDSPGDRASRGPYGGSSSAYAGQRTEPTGGGGPYSGASAGAATRPLVRSGGPMMSANAAAAVEGDDDIPF